MDLNSDLGEGFGAWRMGDDEAMLDIVTSANIACGFHAGDPSVMRRVCAMAAERGQEIELFLRRVDLSLQLTIVGRGLGLLTHCERFIGVVTGSASEAARAAARDVIGQTPRRAIASTPARESGNHG